MEYEAACRELSGLLERRFAHADGCHDFDHTLRVVRNAMRLCDELPAADRELVRFAALLHDVARADEDRDRGGCDHAERGAAMVPGLLAPFGFPPEWIERAAQAVRTHRYRDDRRPASLEAEIVYDADKLDSLGATGIGRAFLFAGRQNARLHNRRETALAAPAYSREDTAYREYLVKLSKLPDAVITAPARRIARERADFMERFFAVLNEETDNMGELEE